MNVHCATHDLPDAGGGMCCIGSAAMGPERCTCWLSEYDIEQTTPVAEGPMQVQAKMCADCAYRPDSPERNGAAGFAHNNEEELDDLSCGDKVFVCHQGMRRRLALVHPSGARVEEGPGAYAPIEGNHRTWQANGQPAFLCAGWWAAKQAKARTANHAYPVDNQRRIR